MQKMSNTSTVRAKLRNDLLEQFHDSGDKRSLSQLLNILLERHLCAKETHEKANTIR